MDTPRAEGGLGPLDIPLLSDLTKEMARDYGVLMEEKGFAARCAVFSANECCMQMTVCFSS